MTSQDSLRFCMVTTFYPPYHFGGDAVFVYRLTNELARRGHHVQVVHCVDAFEALTSRSPESDRDYPNHPDVTVHRLRTRARTLSPLITHQTGHPGPKAARLREILEGGNFDVVHFHNISLIGPRALSYGTGIKLYTLHEHWLVCPLSVLWKFNRAPCTSKQCIPCTIHAKRPPQLWRYAGLLDSMLEHIDAFIAPSRFTAGKHLEMGLKATAPIVQIPLFVPHPTHPDPAIDEEPPYPRPYFLFVGRLEKLKGVQVLIEAFRGHRGVDLLIAGSGEYETHLRRMAKGLSHVHFLGGLHYNRLAEIYRDAIAVVVPSLGYEVFGTVIAEAFSQRTPAIVHDLGALPELIEQSGGGLVYRDESGLIDSLQALESNPQLRRSLGERGYTAYLKHLTPEPHMQRYFELIDRIAADRRVGPEAVPPVPSPHGPASGGADGRSSAV